MMSDISFFFSTFLSTERLAWVAGLARKMVENRACVRVFLTGDAQFSLLDARHSVVLDGLLAFECFHLHVDRDEMELHGISRTWKGNVHVERDFWGCLLEHLKAASQDHAGFLELDGPYMSRATVHSCRFLHRVIDAGLSPELYLYIDGVHAAHAGQKPSEFENIGQDLQDIHERALNKGLIPKIYACSRCGTARGYASDEFDEVRVKSPHGIPACDFVNLNSIVSRFKERHPIIEADCCLFSGSNKPVTDRVTRARAELPCRLVILITKPPYGQEHVFGGLSFAIAAAGNHEIETAVVFLEDGVFSICTEHAIKDGTRLFNIHDILVATADMDNLSYHCFAPSLEARGLSIPASLKFIKRIDSAFLFASVAGSVIDQSFSRVLFF